MLKSFLLTSLCILSLSFLSSCRASASELRNTPGSAPMICYQTAINELTKAEALDLCSGAQSDPWICYRIAQSNGLTRTDAIKLCKGS